MQTKGQLQKSQDCFFVCTTFDSFLNDLAFSNIGKRIANSLLRKMELENTRELALTHEALAKDIGSAREVISRTLKHFQELGIVQLSRGRIEIIDVEELKKQ